MRSPAALQASNSTNGAMAFRCPMGLIALITFIMASGGSALIVFARLRTGR
jgi:hypothetical protein